MRMKWQRVGEIGVDAGLCWLGDPCYVLHRSRKPKSIGKDWQSFCDKILDTEGVTKFKYDRGHEGLGVAVSTGWGDGVYNVYVQHGDEGRIARVMVEFMPEEKLPCQKQE